MNKKKTDAVLNNQNQDLEEIEEDLTEEFIEKENKTAMQVHSAHLKNVPNMGVGHLAIQTSVLGTFAVLPGPNLTGQLPAGYQ